MVAPTTSTFSWQTPAQTPTYPTVSRNNVFSKIEVRDILIAWLGIGFAVAIAFSGGVFASFSVSSLAILMGIALITVGPGFIFHELSHKFVARHYGFWAEFRMWPQMLAMAIMISLIGFFFAAPGATYISGNNISKEENGLISLAGPLTNAVIAALFIPVYFIGGYGDIIRFIGAFGLWVNTELAVFNLIPLGPLDGAKVFAWNKVIWGVTIGALAIAAYVVFTQVYLSVI